MTNPVLLLHGFGTTAARTWRDNGWIDLLADLGRTVVAPDLPGHGPPPQPHDPAAYAGLAGQVAELLPAPPVVLDAIGFSQGSRLLLELAADDPARFGRLVVTGVGANVLRHDDSDALARALASDVVADHPLARYFQGLAADGDRDALVAFLRRPGQSALTPQRLAGVTCPVLVVLGEDDFAGPAEPLVEALPNATLVSVPRLDHFATPKDLRVLDAALTFLGAAP
ncbi:MAG: alpha/beta fold hydrolase [Acidimicrobiales bacterium]